MLCTLPPSLPGSSGNSVATQPVCFLQAWNSLTRVTPSVWGREVGRDLTTANMRRRENVVKIGQVNIQILHIWVSIPPSRIKNTLVTRAEQPTQCHCLAAKAHVSLSPIWSGRLLSGADLSLGHDGSSKPAVWGIHLRPCK